MAKTRWCSTHSTGRFQQTAGGGGGVGPLQGPLRGDYKATTGFRVEGSGQHVGGVE